MAAVGSTRVFVITHGLSPVIGCGLADLATGKRLALRDLVLIGLAGAAPDILSPHLSLASRLASWTHNVWFLLGAIPVWVLFSHRFASRRRRVVTGLLMALATAFHLFCDAIAGGIAWLYPMSDSVIGRRWIPYSSWLWLDLACLAGVALLTMWRRKARSPTLDTTVGA